MDRKTLENVYALAFNCPKPPLQSQLCDTALGWQFKEVRAGRVGCMPTTKMVPYLPDNSMRMCTQKEKTTTVDGMIKESEEYQLIPPVILEALRTLWTRFQVNFLMSIAGNSHIEILQINKGDMDELYQFIDGPRVARKDPPPTVATLMAAERAVWRELAIKVHGGTTLKQAMTDIPSDATLWQVELYSKDVRPLAANDPAAHPHPGHDLERYPYQLTARPDTAGASHSWEPYYGGGGKYGGSGKGGGGKWNNPYGGYGQQQQGGKWNQGGKYGKYDGGKQSGKWSSKSKNQGEQWKGKSSYTPINKDEVNKKFEDGTFSRVGSNNKEVCMAHHYGKCMQQPWESCGKTHSCPRILRNGDVCGGSHRGMHCIRE
jgi:hypothetical protein